MTFTYLCSSCWIYIFYFLLFCFLIYELLTWPYSLAKKYGLTGPDPLPLFGNMFQFSKRGFHVCDMENQKKHGHIYPVYMGLTGMFMVSDETILRQILVRDSKSFVDRPPLLGMSKLMQRNLSVLKGNEWERVRALISPIFTSVKLKMMYPMIVGSVNKMMDRIKDSRSTKMDVKELYSALTMNAIAKTMFGIEIDVSENNTHAFIKHARKLFELSTSNILFTVINIFPQLSGVIDYFYPNGFVSPESEKYLVNCLATTIESRRKGKEEYHDFLALMIKAHDDLSIENQDAYIRLTEEEIMAQSIVFMFAGYETTATALTLCTDFLSRDLSAQEEIYNELMEHIQNDEEITYEHLSNFHLLEQCLNETLRITPPVTRFARTCTKESTITSSTGQVMQVKPGMQFVVPVYAIHHDERLWPNPEQFDMHRFDQDKRQKSSTFSFMPFGMGPRGCIGLRFAWLESKLALANLVRNYRFLPCDQSLRKLTFAASTLLTIKDPVYIRLEKR